MKIVSEAFLLKISKSGRISKWRVAKGGKSRTQTRENRPHPNSGVQQTGIVPLNSDGANSPNHQTRRSI